MPDGPTTASTPSARSLPQTGRDLVVASEERLRVLGLVGQQAAVGHTGADLDDLRASESGSWRRIASSSEISSSPGSRPSSSRSSRARAVQHLERLGLPAREVQRPRQQRPPPFPERRRPGQRPRLLGDRARAAGGDLGLDAKLLAHRGEGPRAGQPPTRPGSQSSRSEQRSTAPQRQRLSHDVGGPVRVAVTQVLARPPERRSNVRASTSSSWTTSR